MSAKPRTITITEKGEFILPRVVELARQGKTTKQAFAQAEAEWEAKKAVKQ